MKFTGIKDSRQAARRTEVSVVIATRNRLAWLQQCLGSVLSQRGVDLDVLVINDASSDGTRDWLTGFHDSRLRVIHHETWQERATARNAGLALARGPYIMFLDDDDQLWPDALTTLISALERHLEAVAAVGARQAWFVAERFRRREPHPRRDLLRDVRMEVIFGWCVTGGQVVMRTEVARAIGGFRCEFVPCEDRYFWQELSRIGPFAFVPDTVLTYRQHPGQVVDENRDALRWRVARRGIAALPRGLRRRALRLRQARNWFDRSERSMLAGRILRGLWEMGRGFAASSGVLTSPLLGEWVLRWLLGRGLRFYIPTNHVEREGTHPSAWRCPPGALAFHPDAPVVPPGVKAHPILVQLSGGAGNQLFQHAAALVLASQTGSGISYVPTDSPWRSRDPGLELLAGPVPGPRVSDLLRFGLPPFPGQPRIRRRWRTVMNAAAIRRVLWRKEGEFREAIELPLIGSGLLLAGYFQSLDWIEGALDGIAQSMLERKPSTVSCRPEVIGISLRTGPDFQRNGWVLPGDYYRAALLRHAPHRSSPLWIIGDVEEDVARMTALLGAEGWRVEPVPVHGEIKLINDFWNLAAAGTLVLSNSTFAWWAAVAGDYLHAPHPRRVIFPDPWQPGDRHGLRRPEWITQSVPRTP